MATKNNESPGFSWAYRDMLTTLMIVFMALGLYAIIALIETKKLEGVQPGQLYVEMDWKVGSYTDMDVWTQTPEDEPVGYARPAGKNCDLLRDDLGLGQDKTSHAIELLVCRDPIPGSYLINVMAYQFHGPLSQKEFPMEVTVKILKSVPKGKMKELYTKTVIIDHVGQEITVVRFDLDDKQEIIEGSVNDVPKMIRTHQGEN